MAITKVEAIDALQVGDTFAFTDLSAPVDGALEMFPEVQVAVQAATASARTAISLG